MDATQAITPGAFTSGFFNFERVFERARKTTVIQLRWPLVILCAYLLLYSSPTWLTQSQATAILLFYILTNATLYFVAEDRFDSPAFYGPLLCFDTIFLAFVIGVTGSATADFYLACFVTLVLSCICNNWRGLLVVTFLAPVLYGYVIFTAGVAHDPALYLRLPFPWVISLFYGYFAQVERLRRIAREKEQQAEQERRAAAEIRRQRERLEVLHEIYLATTSKVDPQEAIESFIDKALTRLSYRAAMVRLRDRDGERMITAAATGVSFRSSDDLAACHALLDEVALARRPRVVQDSAAEPADYRTEALKEEGWRAWLVFPLIADGKSIGSLAFFSLEPIQFSPDDGVFFSTLAGQAAIAIEHAQLFRQTCEQAEQLRDANRVKDEFLAVVSHELKTPLNVISGYTNMLLERILGEVSPIQEKALQTMLRQSKNLNGMINSVLQVSCIEAEMIRPEIHETNFWEFFYELKTYYDYPLAKDIRLIWDLPVELPKLYTDRGKLKHILQNLINNAIKFTDRGEVTISARYLSVKKVMEFKVADTGIGIDKELCPKIFERFRQVDSSDSRSYGGVGLGLYIVKKFTDLLGGTVQVDSKPGAGSTFTVRVPCYRHAPQEQLSLPAAIGGAARPTESVVLA